jgi:hypothetical protein
MSILSLSAQQYPGKIVLQSDTLICFLPNQVTTLNCMIVDLYECREERTNLNITIQKYEELINSQNLEYVKMNDMILNLSEQIAVKGLLVDEKDDVIKSRDKAIRKYKLKLLLNQIVTGVFIVTTIYFIIK